MSILDYASPLAEAIGIPSSDSKIELPKTYWINYPHGSGAFCSNCHGKIRYKDKLRFKYCPFCGKKISLEE